MKVFSIFPLIDMFGPNRDERADRCISLVTDIVCQALRRNGDDFHCAVDWKDPGSLDSRAFSTDIAEPQIVWLRSEEALRRRVTRSVDPNVGEQGTIRFIATCRAVTFGYDGQAFLCLRHEDEPPHSPDVPLIKVEERPDILLEFDYFDGWVRKRFPRDAG